MDSTGGAGGLSSTYLSDDGQFASQWNTKELIIHLNPTSSEFQDVQIAKVKENVSKFLKFSRADEALPADAQPLSQRRMLHASDTRILIWSLDPLQLHAEIDSLEPGALAVDFGGDENEIIVFHAWNTKVSIHGLDTGRSQVIKTPKFSHYNGFGYRPKSRQFAILLKPDAADLLTIHEFRSYELVGRTVLPTVDAQGLKWSPDGRWIAVWDAASAGTKVLIFTADGQLFRSYIGPPESDISFDLGVRGLEWSPVSTQSGASEILAVGKVDGTVDLLRSKTFSCSTSLSHIFQIDQNSPTVWREHSAAADGNLEYAEAPSASAYSIIGESSGSPRGVSTMAFSSDGSLLATVDQTRPHILWIWNMESTAVLVSVLVHEHAVRQVLWHPSKPQMLITTTSSAAATVRYWAPDKHPFIAYMPASRSESGRYDLRWVSSDQENDSRFWFGTPEEYVCGFFEGEELRVLNSIHSKVPAGSHGANMSR